MTFRYSPHYLFRSNDSIFHAASFWIESCFQHYSFFTPLARIFQWETITFAPQLLRVILRDVWQSGIVWITSGSHQEFDKAGHCAPDQGPLSLVAFRRISPVFNFFVPPLPSSGVRSRSYTGLAPSPPPPPPLRRATPLSLSIKSLLCDLLPGPRLLLHHPPQCFGVRSQVEAHLAKDQLEQVE